MSDRLACNCQLTHPSSIPSDPYIFDRCLSLRRNRRYLLSSWMRRRVGLKRLINLVCVESNDDRTVNDDHRSGHVTKFLEIGQGAGILSYVPLLKG